MASGTTTSPRQRSRWALDFTYFATGPYGLGQFNPDRYDPKGEDAFVVDFVGHYKWVLQHASRALMRVEYSVPRLPFMRIEETSFKEEADRVLAGVDGLSLDALWELVSVATEQIHGTMVVVSPNAAEEAVRLASQATPIEPTILTSETVRRVTAIDGAVLVDPKGVCHAIGVILDGTATPHGTPARGARFNSAIRYVESAGGKTLAIVISEDGHIDLIPTLRPRIHKHVVKDLVTVGIDALRVKNWEKVTQALSALSKLRFYLDPSDCVAANDILREWNASPVENGEIRLVYGEFFPALELDESYFIGDISSDRGA